MKPWHLFVFFFELACVRISIKAHRIENRCYGTRKYTVCHHVRASFSPELLQAGAVKGLMVNWLFLAFVQIMIHCSSSTGRKWAFGGKTFDFLPCIWNHNGIMVLLKIYSKKNPKSTLNLWSDTLRTMLKRYKLFLTRSSKHCQQLQIFKLTILQQVCKITCFHYGL